MIAQTSTMRERKRLRLDADDGKTTNSGGDCNVWAGMSTIIIFGPKITAHWLRRFGATARSLCARFGRRLFARGTAAGAKGACTQDHFTRRRFSGTLWTGATSD